MRILSADTNLRTGAPWLQGLSSKGLQILAQLSPEREAIYHELLNSDYSVEACCKAIELYLQNPKGCDDHVTQGAIQNTKLPPELLTRVVKLGLDDEVSWYAVKNQNCPVEALIFVVSNLDPRAWVAHQAARNPNLPEEYLAFFRRNLSRMYFEEELLESHRKAANQTWYKTSALSSRDYDLFRYINTVLAKPDCSTQEIQRIFNIYSDDPVSHTNQNTVVINYWILELIAEHPNCPPEILTKLLLRQYPLNVQKGAIMNKNCSPETLEFIATNPKLQAWPLKYRAIDNQNFPVEGILKIISLETDHRFIDFVLNHPKTPQEYVDLWNRNLDREEFDEELRDEVEKKVKAMGGFQAEANQKIAQDFQIPAAKDYKPGYLNLAMKIEDPNCPPGLIAEILNKFLADQNSVEPGIIFRAVKHCNCPVEMLEKIILYVLSNQDGDVPLAYRAACAAIKNPKVPAELLAKVLQENPNHDSSLSWYAARNPNTPPEHVALWNRNIDRLFFDRELKGATSNLTPSKTWYKQSGLFSSLEYEAIFRSVTNKNCPKEVLLQVINKAIQDNNFDSISSFAIRHPNCPPELIAKLLQDIFLKNGMLNGTVAYAAQSSKATPEILSEILSTNEDNLITRLAASNSNALPEDLARIANRGDDDGVSRYAVRNPNCPSEILIKILQAGRNDSISFAAASNPSAPQEYVNLWKRNIERRDFDRELRVEPYLNKNQSSTTTWYKTAQTIQQVMSHNCPPEVLRRILESGLSDDNPLIGAAARNPNCPPDILVKILNDENRFSQLRRLVSQNPSTPVESLVAILAKNYNDSLSYFITFNPNIPQENIDMWNRNMDRKIFDTELSKQNPPKTANIMDNISVRNKDCSPEILSRIIETYIRNYKAQNLLKGEDVTNAALAVMHTNCPPRLLVKLVEREISVGTLSQIAASNPNCPPEVLAAILKGDSRYISCEHLASENPNAPQEYVDLYHRNRDRQRFDYELNKEAAANRPPMPFVSNREQTELESKNCSAATITRILNRWLALGEKRSYLTDEEQVLVSVAAASQNCPIEILNKILLNNPDLGVVSEMAAQNPNTPIETLIAVSQREYCYSGLATAVSQNPNFPQEHLEMLERNRERVNFDFQVGRPQRFALPFEDSTDKTAQSGRSNPEEPGESVEKLERANQRTLMSETLGQPDCPPETLTRALENYIQHYNNNGHVDANIAYAACLAAGNHNCPPTMLVKILQQINMGGSVSQIAASNPSVPQDVLAAILQRDTRFTPHVGYFAANNPNAPQEYIDLWERNAERANFDHYLKQPEIEEHYEQGFDVIANSVQDQSVILKQVQSLNCPPELITEILQQGRNDLISQLAADHPNCPPEALTMILQRGKNDYVSQLAARHDDCPAEALTMVLQQGRNDRTSEFAARNPNCPAETLMMVIQRKNDNISFNAAYNPNCPQEYFDLWERNQEREEFDNELNLKQDGPLGT